MIISIERERNTPTPGKSPRYRARIYASRTKAPAVLISAANFGSVARAREAMDEFFGVLAWIDDYAEDSETRATAQVNLP